MKVRPNPNSTISFKKSQIESEEQQLLKNLSQGNTIAFWQLWEHHQQYLYKRCLGWMGGNSTEASEALSRAMLKAWEKLPNYAEKITNPKAWLTRMTHNLCIDIHRENQRGAKHIDCLETIAVGEDETLTSNLDSPESALLRRELIIYIRSAINNLPPKLREPFILHCYHQMSYKDISRQLCLSQDNVYKRIQQARTILKKRLLRYLSGLDNSVIDEFQQQQSETSTSQIPKTTKDFETIDYQVTAICLETLSPLLFR